MATENKLVCAKSISRLDSFSETIMHGVASLLSRVGLRSKSCSPLASRGVADFMATLRYVSYKQDRFVYDYVSDLILTFGAAQVWYIHECNLAQWSWWWLASCCYWPWTSARA